MLNLPAEPKPKRFNAVIETPKGSRNKFAFDPHHGVFEVGKQLPAGAVFPFHFGFVPSTTSDDGDPLDVLVLLDAPTFPGCVVRVRLVGVIEAEQSTKSGKMVANPRLIGVATKSVEYDGVKELDELPNGVLDDVEHFFVSYNAATGKVFRPTARGGPKRARRLVRKSASSDGPRDGLVHSPDRRNVRARS